MVDITDYLKKKFEEIAHRSKIYYNGLDLDHDEIEITKWDDLIYITFPGLHRWNDIGRTLTPAQAREMAEALLKAASDANAEAE